MLCPEAKEVVLEVEVAGAEDGLIAPLYRLRKDDATEEVAVVSMACRRNVTGVMVCLH